jgi:hypothetical protein
MNVISLKNMWNAQRSIDSEYDGEVLVDFWICSNQDLEQCVSKKQFADCLVKIKQFLSGPWAVNLSPSHLLP